MQKVSLATYLIEGEKKDVDAIEANVKDAAWKFWGVTAGPKYGDRAYLMTFTICYIRVRNVHTLKIESLKVLSSVLKVFLTSFNFKVSFSLSF